MQGRSSILNKLPWTQGKPEPLISLPELVSLTTLRVVAGVIMLAHGFQKLIDLEGTQHAFHGMDIPYADVAAILSTGAEVLGGGALLLGLFTPIAALLIAFNMLVAIALVHLPHGLFAKNGGFEFPLLIFTTSVYFMTRGAGSLSVDAAWKNHMHKRLHRNEQQVDQSGKKASQTKTRGGAIDKVSEAGQESFPASDPPSYNPGSA